MNYESPSRTWPSWILPLLTVVWLGLFVYLGLASRLPEIPGLTGRGNTVASSGHLLTTLVLAVLVFALVRARDLTRPTVRVAVAAAIVAALLGGAIEVLQSFSRTRTPELADWAFDGLGAILGVALVATIDQREPWRPRLIGGAHVLGGLATALAGAAILIWPPISVEEVTAFCPPDVDERMVRAQPLEPGTGSRTADGLLVLYRFQDSTDEVSQVTPGLDLQLEGSIRKRSESLRITGHDGVARSAGPASAILEAIVASNAFTLEAWVQPRNLLQRGPARILSASRSTSLGEVNFHLGQERTCLSFRVATGTGEAEWLLTDGVFTMTQPAWHIAVTYQAGSVAVFVDGRLVDERRVEGPGLGGWDLTMPLLVGNEATQDRGFRGDIFLIAVYDRPLTADDIVGNFRAGALAQ